MPVFTAEELLIMVFIAVGVGIYILGKVLEHFIERAKDKEIVKREKDNKLWK